MKEHREKERQQGATHKESQDRFRLRQVLCAIEQLHEKCFHLDSYVQHLIG
jgi:hypothetical protein